MTTEEQFRDLLSAFERMEQDRRLRERIRPMRLTDAAEALGMPAQALRREAKAGRLHISRVGGKDFVLIDDLERLFKCPDPKKARDYGSDRKAAKAIESDRPPGSLRTDQFASAQASALSTVKKLKKRSRTILRENIAPTETARVIPLKSA